LVVEHCIRILDACCCYLHPPGHVTQDSPQT
jgi:hypothetical protein